MKRCREAMPAYYVYMLYSAMCKIWLRNIFIRVLLECIHLSTITIKYGDCSIRVYRFKLIGLL